MCAVICGVLFIGSCTTDVQLFENYGCMQQKIVPVSAHSIDGDTVAVVNQLFVNNNISSANFRYTRYERFIFQTSYAPYAQYNEQVVRLLQYTNSLPVFNGDLIFVFWNGALHYETGNVTKGTTLNTSPHLNLAQIRALFLADIKKNAGNSVMYSDSCFQAEFGYYNVNAGVSNAFEKLVKAWHVTPKNSSYPEAYYNDEQGSLLYYFDGLCSL